MNQEEFNRLWEESGRKQEAMMADVRSKHLSNEDKELLNSVILQRWLDGSNIIDNDENEPDEERARAFVSVQQWIFAKTMADIPHFYCLKHNSPGAAEFDWFVQYLVAHSVPGTFYGRMYQYLFLDDWKFWIMDDNPTDCDLINREFQK